MINFPNDDALVSIRSVKSIPPFQERGERMGEGEKGGKVTHSGALAFHVLRICSVSCARLWPVSDVQGG